MIFRVPEKKIPHLACLLARLLRYIHRHGSRYAPQDVPCRRTQIRRNLVELFLTVTLNCTVSAGNVNFCPHWDEIALTIFGLVYSAYIP